MHSLTLILAAAAIGLGLAASEHVNLHHSGDAASRQQVKIASVAGPDID